MFLRQSHYGDELGKNHIHIKSGAIKAKSIKHSRRIEVFEEDICF